MSEPFEAVEIIAALYRTLLLREPDPGGLAMAAQHLRETHDLELLLRGVLQSPEFKDRLPLFLTHYQPEPRLGEPDAVVGEGHPFCDPDFLDAHIRAHPALQGDVLRALGEPVVKLTNPRVYRLSQDVDRTELHRLGVRVHDLPAGQELLIVMDSSAAPVSLEVRAQNQSGNLIVLGPECTIHGEIHFGGGDNLIYMSGRAGHPQSYRIAVYTYACAFVFGYHCTSVGSSFHIEGPNHHLVVGRDCMFAADVYVAGTDNHAVVELDTGRVLNLGQSLTIGPHAWLGFGSTVLKGAHVGEGAVLASRSVLTTPCPPHTLMAGSPARHLRDNISWDRGFPSTVDARRRAQG